MTETSGTPAQPQGVFDDGTSVSDSDFEAQIQEAAEKRDGEEDGGESEGTTPADTQAEPAPEPESAGALTAKPADQAPTETETPAKPEDKRQMVPVAALQEQREKRQEERDQRMLAEGRLKVLQEQIEARKTAPATVAPPPDPETVIAGLMDTERLTRIEAEQRVEITALKAKTTEFDKFREEQVQQAKQQTLIAEVQSTYETAASAFTATNPDFMDAYQHGVNSRAKELRLRFPQATEAQISQQVTRDDLTLAAEAIKDGRNPAEVAYQYATEVYGYVPGVGPGGAAGGAVKEELTPGQKKLANVAGGQEAAKSASNGSGAAAEELTFESLRGKGIKEFQEGFDRLVPSNNDIF